MFGVVNAIRLPMGLFTFLGPLSVVLFYEPRLNAIASVLAFGRLLACFIHIYFVWKLLPNDHGPLRFNKEVMYKLFSFGGWITVSNVISPFMGYVDRFLIGAIISSAAITYYVTPNDMVTKLWIIPGAFQTQF